MNILRNKEYLKEKYGKDFVLMDDHLEYIDVFILPHYGHLTCLEFALNKYRYPLHNNTHNIGNILHHFSVILGVREDGSSLRDLSQSYKPVRSIWTVDPTHPNGGECVGMGHSYEDKFILFEEFHLAEV